VVEAKRQWLFDKLSHPQKYHHRPDPPGKEVVNGGVHTLPGKGIPDQVAETESGEIEFRHRLIVPAAHLKEIMIPLSCRPDANGRFLRG